MKMRVASVAAAASLLALGCVDSQRPLAPSVQADATSKPHGIYEVIDIGTFNTSTAQAFGINDAGLIAGRYGAPSRSFAWTQHAGMHDLGDVDGRPFQFLHLNNRGEMTGWVSTPGLPGVSRAVVRDRDGVFQYVDDDQHSSAGWSINDRGAIAGSRIALTSGATYTGFVWTREAGLEIIAPWPSPRPLAQTFDINNDGQVVGSTNYKDPAKPYLEERPFIWDEVNGMRLLPGLGGFNIVPTRINDDGVVVGAGEIRRAIPGDHFESILNFSPLGTIPSHAWRWSEARGMEDLGTLGGKHSVAWTVDKEGNAYGWAEDAAGGQYAVKWTWSRPTQTLKLAGVAATRSQAGSVNARGVLAGQAADASGLMQAVSYVPDGQQNFPNVLKGDSIVLITLADPSTDLLVIEGFPYPLTSYTKCGGTAGAEFVPLNQSGEMSGVIKSLTTTKDASFYVWKLSEFRGYCHTPPMAYGRGSLIYTDNDTYQTSNHVDTWGFQIKAEVTIFATGEQKTLFAHRRVSMIGGEFTNHITQIELR